MEDDQDYYTILGVPPDAPEAEIRRAFRTRAKEIHPDSKPAGEHGAAYREFNSLTEAYETLRDAGRREAYDEELARARQLARGGRKHGRRPLSFAMGFALGLSFAVIGVGAKIYFDRAAVQAGGLKSQESLTRPENAAVPQGAEPASEEGGGTGRIIAASGQDAQNGPVVPVPSQDPAGPERIPAPDGTQPEASSGPSIAADQTRRVAPGRAEDAQRAPDAMPSAQDETSRLAAAPPATQPATPDAGHSQFASAVLALERSISSGGGEASANRLVSLVNSAAKSEELTEAATLARRPETLELIGTRMAALKDNRPADPAPGARGRSKESGTIEVATGQRASETVLRLKPGNGLSESFSDCPSCPEMVVIPNGQAIVGSRPESAGYRPEQAPAHRVSFRKPLAISKYGISAGNWRACVDAGVCRPTLSSYLSIGPGVPATRVSWFEAKAYVEWLSQLTGRRYRLLSEAEWEYSAQGGSEGHPAETAASPGAASPVPPAEIGLLRLPARDVGVTRPNGWGLHALPGNVLEWVEDCWHSSYAQAPADGSPWLSGAGGDCAYRAVRGAGGGLPGRRLPARAREFADTRSPTLGFRVARELSAPPKAAVDATAAAGRKSPRGD